jgi:hypothetical protein
MSFVNGVCLNFIAFIQATCHATDYTNIIFTCLNATHKTNVLIILLTFSSISPFLYR